MKYKVRSRQIHMDFHTSSLIKDIGEKFDKEEFAETLNKAKVNSVTCFARCHHGYLYYDSKINKERIHPNLKNINLLKDQMEACHNKEINVPIYTTVQWDRYTFDEHPEWASVDIDGSFINGQDGKEGFYEFLCVNTPYRQFLKDHVKELIETFRDLDGLFFDILIPHHCACKYCIEDMKKRDIDYSLKEERLKFSVSMLNKFKAEVTEFIQSLNPNISIFYNASHISPAVKNSTNAYSHLEIESLPSGGWGYMHFPITIRYARNLGKECVGMTGKFHTYWGDFHSFKNLAALQFECFQMLSHNAKCSIGDQLEPNGRISKEVYDLIGKVYSEVEEKEPWCKDGKAVCEIGVFNPEEFIDYNDEDPFKLQPCIIGATRILQEASLQFDIIDSKYNFTSYKLLILPEKILINEKFKNKLEEYVKSGGKVIATYESGLKEDKSEFNLSFLKIKYEGAGEYTPSFIVPQEKFSKDLYNTEYTMYLQCTKVKGGNKGEILSVTKSPYFNRSKDHYCSHQHAPSSGNVYGSAIVKGQNSIYFCHRIFSQYYSYGSIWCKKLLLNAVDMLLGKRLINHNGPSTLITTLNEQKFLERYILHLLHYIPERRCERIDIIEDVIPLHNIDISLNLDKNPKSIKLVPQNKELPFYIENKSINFTIDKINGHEMIEIQC